MIAEQLKDIFREFTPRSLARLPDIYRNDVVFVDPVHRVEGLAALHRYFASVAELMMTGVLGTSEGKGPPAPVGVTLMRLTTSMPLTTLPKTV